MSGGGGSGGAGGQPYDPKALGNLFGNRLTGYLQGDAPVFDESLYTGLDPRETQGYDLMRDAALAGRGGLQSSYNSNNELIRQRGLTDPMRYAMENTNAVANQYGTIAGGLGGPSGAQTDYEGIADSLGGPSAAQTGFSDIAGSLSGPSYAETGYRGLFDEGGGPSLTEQRLGDRRYGTDSEAYNTLRSKLADDVTTQNLAAFNNAGLFGSDDNRSSLAEGLGTALAGMDVDQMRYGDALERGDLAAIEGQRQQDYTNRERALGEADAARFGQLDRRMGALGASDAARLGQINTRMSAIGAGDSSRLAQLRARMDALGQRSGALSTLFNQGQTGITNTMAAGDRMGSRYEDMLRPGETLAGIGQAYTQDAQARRLDEYDRFNRTKNANYNRFRELLGDFSGSQGNAGMKEQVPFWQQLMGYVGGNIGNAIGAARA